MQFKKFYFYISLISIFLSLNLSKIIGKELMIRTMKNQILQNVEYFSETFFAFFQRIKEVVKL
jgi:hypothetical protein